MELKFSKGPGNLTEYIDHLSLIPVRNPLSDFPQGGKVKNISGIMHMSTPSHLGEGWEGGLHEQKNEHVLISLVLIFFISIFLSGCKVPDNDASESGRAAKINPDYSGVTIPPNIAPLNFSIEEPGSSFFARISSAAGNGIEIHSNKGKIQIPRKKWSELLDANKGTELKTEIYIRDEHGKWLKYNDIINFISNDPVDPYLYYRILYPGYESWSELTINRRELSGFGTKPVLVNTKQGNSGKVAKQVADVQI